MAPSNPKRPPRPPRPPGASASKKEDVELPFDDDEVAPLQEDDPRPQRVPQYPAGPRRTTRGPRGAREGTKDRELATRFDTNEYSDPGHVPAFLYVEKGPGTGQLIPVKQGPLVIGRASVCELRLQHPSISRRHAQLMRQGDRFLLRDLGSQNGTFVNRLKVSGDREIRIGDEISLGNALLKLRGHGTITSDRIPQAVPSAPVRQPKRKGMSLTRIALIAAAVGSAAAALLTVVFVKFSGPGQPVSSSTEGAPPSTDTPVQEAEADYIPPPPASEEEEAQAAASEDESPAAPADEDEERLAAAAESEEESARALKALQPPTDTAAPEKPKASAPRVSALIAKPSASRKESSSKSSIRGSSRKEAPSEPSRAAEKPPAPQAVKVGPAEVLALYEKGEVAAALNLAHGGELGPLATQIAEYQRAVGAGQKALSARDTASAIQHLSTALVVDQELSHGWSIQGRKLRKQLGRLYTQVGQEHVKAGHKDAAREAFELALKYDPSNTWAKAELQELKGKP